MAIIIFLLIITASSIILMGLGIWQWMVQGRYVQFGVPTTAIVTDVTPMSSRRMHSSEVKYTYIVKTENDQTHYQGIIYDRRGLFKRGSRVRIHYLKDKPQMSQITSGDWRLGATFTLLFGVILLGMCLYVWAEMPV